jgi:microcystin-dependent protein
MSDPFLGEIRIFGFTFAPQGWALCNGQTLSISQNTALFALLGTTYGGNGTSNFQLPNLESRVPVHFGQGAGLSPYTQGQMGGTENHTLTVGQLPAHNHPVAIGAAQTTDLPAGAVLAQNGAYATTVASGNANAGFVQDTGGNTPFPILQPYLTLNFCIALEGIFPSRN